MHNTKYKRQTSAERARYNTLADISGYVIYYPGESIMRVCVLYINIAPGLEQWWGEGGRGLSAFGWLVLRVAPRA